MVLPIHDSYLHPDGRISAITLSLPAFPVRLIAVYAPATRPDLPAFFNDLTNVLESFMPELPVILAGDFNCVENQALDSSNPHALNPGESSLHEMVTSFSLVDVFREQHPNTKTFTNKSPFSNRRLDRFYVTRAIIEMASSGQFVRPPRAGSSTHLSPRMSFSISQSLTGPGTFRFALAWLSEPWIPSLVRSEVLYLIQTRWNNTNASLEAWDDIKCQIRVICQSVSRFASSFNQRYAPDAWHHHRHIGKHIRARYPPQYSAPPDCPALEVRLNQTRQAGLMEGLRDETGQLFSSPIDMARLANNFYSTLYNNKNSDPASLSQLNLALLPTVTDSDRAELETPFTLKELTDAARASRHGSCPGPDGLPTEFYLEFWDILGPVLTSLPEQILLHNSFSPSQRQAQVCLLFKQGDKFDLQNWRPISLLNCDYKIITCALSRRLLKVIASLVHENQAAFIPDRWIGNAIADMEAMMGIAWPAKFTLATALLDFQKAYDNISHEYLQKVLEQYGFGPRFLSLLDSTTKDISSSIMCNGWLSNPVAIKSGIRQGDPVAPLLFVLALEPLCVSLRRKLNGIRFPSAPLQKVLAYADDISIFLSTPAEANTVMQLIQAFERAGGGKLNPRKSRVVLNISDSHPDYRPIIATLSFARQKLPFKYLGVMIGLGQTWNQEASELELSFLKALDRFYLSGLPLRTICWIINTYVVPRLVYVDQFHPLSDAMLERLQKRMIAKLWNGHRRLLRAEVVTAPIDTGGLGMCSLKKKLLGARAKWIIRLTYPNSHLWAAVARYSAQQAGMHQSRLKFVDRRFRRVSASWVTYFTKPLAPNQTPAWNYPIERWTAALHALRDLRLEVIHMVRGWDSTTWPRDELGPANIDPRSFIDKKGQNITLSHLTRTQRQIDHATPVFAVHHLSAQDSQKRWKYVHDMSKFDPSAANSVLLYMHSALLTVDRLSPDWVVRHASPKIEDPLQCQLCHSAPESNVRFIYECPAIARLWETTCWPASWRAQGPPTPNEFYLWGRLIHKIWERSRQRRFHPERITGLELEAPLWGIQFPRIGAG